MSGRSFTWGVNILGTFMIFLKQLMTSHTIYIHVMRIALFIILSVCLLFIIYYLLSVFIIIIIYYLLSVCFIFFGGGWLGPRVISGMAEVILGGLVLHNWHKCENGERKFVKKN